MHRSAIFSCHVVVISHWIFEVWHRQRICTKQACFLVYCDPLIDLIFWFFYFARGISIICCLVIASSVALTAVFSWIRIINSHWITIQVFYEPFVANVALCRVPVFLPIFIHHNQRPFARHIFTHFSFMFLKKCKIYEYCVFSFVCKWAKSLPITPHDQIRKATWLMLLLFN